MEMEEVGEEGRMEMWAWMGGGRTDGEKMHGETGMDGWRKSRWRWRR